MGDTVEAFLREYSLENPNQEIVAILLGMARPGFSIVSTYVKVKNIHSDPMSNYLIHPLDFLHAESLALDYGAQIVGIGHSHIYGDAEPSLSDLDQMRSTSIPDWWLWPIFSVATGRYAVWRLVDGDPVEVTAS